MAIAANFIFFLGVISIISVLVRQGSQTSQVINATSGLLTNSLKAAKSG